MVIILIFAAIIYGFAVGIWKYAIKPFVIAFKRGYSDRWKEIHAPPENDNINDINRLERIENYGIQIDGYRQLIKTYDSILNYETDDKKRAAILAKQLVTIEKLNKTIEKWEKLDY